MTILRRCEDRLTAIGAELDRVRNTPAGNHQMRHEDTPDTTKPPGEEDPRP